ncbi:glycosyltransferase family 2 protein [Flavobacterium tyrosinilyticum]|uniref:glycosyltransferase family 2 protein n=1 Tax=Flavobacterium tyrosinilyticum TaxID=1658740 RepID=UPI002030C5E8|nr:glycosyltransferase [Flavobacterium tyrosinilyticum]MCM0668674.1 glycosyltransferase [Flavobacterium tyrosinilyticum]
MNNPMVSVVMMTYGHEKYITQAIEGVLMQEFDFDIELIIANDCSPDKTNSVVERIMEQHPRGNWIKYTSHKENKGVMSNFVWALQQSKGQYIAICEGDDYWTDSLKLQKQVDVLQNNPKLTGCFHNSEERYWNDYTKASSLYLNIGGAREVSLQDMTINNIAPTASIVFRTPVPKEVFSDAFVNLPIGDWPLHLLNLRKGNYYYIPQVMSVRHLYVESTWGMQDQIRNRNIVLNVYDILINSNWFSLSTIQNLKKGKNNLRNPENPFLKILKYRCKRLLSLLRKR